MKESGLRDLDFFLDPQVSFPWCPADRARPHEDIILVDIGLLFA